MPIQFDVDRMKVDLPDNIQKAENGPDYWSSLLENVDEIFGTTSFIGGGAVRDHLLGVLPKDIDIFIHPLDFTRDDLSNMCEELGWGRAAHVHGEEYLKNGSHGEISAFSVYELYPKSSPVPVQLIFKMASKDNYLHDVLSQFDLDICKSAYYNGTIVDTEVAKDDRERKTITYRGEKLPSAKTAARAFRIRNHLEMSSGKNFKFVGLEIPTLKKEKTFDYEKALKFARGYGMNFAKLRDNF